MHRLTPTAIGLVALFSTPALANVAKNEVGVNAHIPSQALIEEIADLGVDMMRVDNNWFQQTDPCSEAIGFFAPLDDAVSYASSLGIGTYMTLAYTPACASTGNRDNGAPSNDVPDAAAYGSYVRQAVAHYRAMGVRHFGLWNEANLEQFFEGSAAEYVSAVVTPGIAAVAAGCADAGFDDCLALGPDLAHVGDYDQFLESTLSAMNDQGLAFDILTHHIYQGHDTDPLSGDSFVNALDQRRFPFTRRSLLDVLEDVGLAPGGVPVTEVWITETGYRAQPATDSGEMAHQSDYLQSTLDEQIARDWYTASFFYEITDSFDDIDGFGITRADQQGGFMLKPAFTDLRDRLAGDPAFGDGAPCGSDAGPSAQPDAGPGGGGNGGGDSGDPGPGSGCGCQSPGRTGGAAALPLLLALLASGRRRRSPFHQ